jgi:ArsR family transcriptional regulator
MNTLSPTPILEHLSALGDETRTRILVLLERSEFTVSELCATLQAPQPTVSRHLRTLADDGWVDSRAEGRNRHYRLADDLGEAHRDLWQVVRARLEGGSVYASDSERARQVLAERRRRSADFFAASADRWDHLRRDLFGARAEFLPLLGFLDPGWIVGDLGTGAGGLAATLAPFVGRIVAVDRSSAMLSAAARRLEGHPNVELRQGDLEALPVGDAELDVAVLSLVLHYVVEPAEALRESWRSLRPGGRVLVVEMRSHDRGPAYAEEMGHVWPGFAEDQMEIWMKDAGFVRLHSRPLPPDPEAAGPLLFLATGLKPHEPPPSHELRPSHQENP